MGCNRLIHTFSLERNVGLMDETERKLVFPYNVYHACYGFDLKTLNLASGTLVSRVALSARHLIMILIYYFFDFWFDFVHSESWPTLKSLATLLWEARSS